MEKVKWIVVILILFMVAGAGVYCWYLPQAHAADENNEPALEEGQEYAYAKITSILGNEMTYVELEAQAVDFNDLREKDGANENASGAKRDMAGQKGYRTVTCQQTVTCKICPHREQSPIWKESPHRVQYLILKECPQQAESPVWKEYPQRQKCQT